MLKVIIGFYRNLTPRQWVAGLLVSMLLLPGVFWWRASRAVDKMMFAAAESMFPVYDIGYDDTFMRMNGEFGAVDVEFDVLDEEGEVLQTFRAERVTVRPPGLAWLLRRTALIKSNAVPERIDVVLQNVRLVTNPGREPFDFSALPYEHAGCGEPFTEQDVVTMAGAVPKGELGYSIEAIGDGRSRIRMWMHSIGLARSEYSYDVRLQRPVSFPDLLERLDASSIERFAIAYRDEGFIGKRNAFCAKRLGLAADALTDRLMSGLSTELTKDGVQYPPEVMERIRRFQQKGGSLRIDTPATVNIPYDVLNDEKVTRLMTGARLQLALDGESAVMFQAIPATAVTGKAADLASNAGQQPGPTAPAVAQEAAAQAPPLKKGEILDAERLQLAVGHEIEITTKHGSVRSGILRNKPILMVSLELPPEDGGVMLTIPQSDITQIRFLQAKRSPSSHTSESASHAKTH